MTCNDWNVNHESSSLTFVAFPMFICIDVISFYCVPVIKQCVSVVLCFTAPFCLLELNTFKENYWTITVCYCLYTNCFLSLIIQEELTITFIFARQKEDVVKKSNFYQWLKWSQLTNANLSLYYHSQDKYFSQKIKCNLWKLWINCSLYVYTHMRCTNTSVWVKGTVQSVKAKMTYFGWRRWKNVAKTTNFWWRWRKVPHK